MHEMVGDDDMTDDAWWYSCMEFWRARATLAWRAWRAWMRCRKKPMIIEPSRMSTPPTTTRARNHVRSVSGTEVEAEAGWRALRILRMGAMAAVY